MFVHAHMRPIIFMYADLAISLYAQQDSAWYCIFIGCRDVFSLKIVGTTLWRLNSIYEPRTHCCSTALKIEATTEPCVCKSLYIYKLYLQMLLGRQSFENDLGSTLFSAIFSILDTTIAPRQRFLRDRRNTTDSLALVLAPFAHFVCVECLTLPFPVPGTMIVREDTHPGDLRLPHVVYCQLQTRKELKRTRILIKATVTFYYHRILTFSQ